MKRILFASRDPGGTRSLIPIISKLYDKEDVCVVAKGNAIPVYSENGIPFRDVREIVSSDEVQDLRELLGIYRPNLVVTGTSLDDFFERNLWMAARELGIKSIAVLDSWCFYGARFSRYTFKEIEQFNLSESLQYLPDKVFAMDNRSKMGLISEGVPDEIIDVVGQPFLQALKESYDFISDSDIKEYKRRLTNSEEKRLIVYASDNLRDSFFPSAIDYWGYDEVSIFEHVYNAITQMCNNPQDYAIIIRPHPKESLKNWNLTIEKHINSDIDIIIDRHTKENLIISSADIIIGMWSMFLVEAVLANRKILSVQIGTHKKASFVLTDQDIIKPIIKQEELCHIMKQFFDGNDSVGRVEWNIKGDSVEKTIKSMYNVLE